MIVRLGTLLRFGTLPGMEAYGYDERDRLIQVCSAAGCQDAQGPFPGATTRSETASQRSARQGRRRIRTTPKTSSPRPAP